MFDSSPQFQTAASASGLQLATTTWSAVPEDVALGCECADPALQIASWGHEAEPLNAGSAS
jgi:hypothetical protein